MARIVDPKTGLLVDVAPGGLGLGAGLAQGANDLGTMIRGGLQGLGNAVGSAVVAPLDYARSGLTSLAGGDQASLGPPLTDQSFALMNQGFSEAGAAANRFGRGLQGTALNVLGAQRATDTPAATAPAVVPAVATAPAVAPAVASNVVAGPADAAAPPLEGAPARTAADLAGTNAAISQGLSALRAPSSPPLDAPTRGNYNMYNTPTSGTRGPVNNGINFGFGAGSAESPRQYLDRMDQRDRQSRLDQRASLDRATYDALASHLNDPFNSTQDKQIILKQMEQSQAVGLTSADQAQKQAGGILGAQVVRETEVSKYSAALAAAQATATGRLAVADTTGQYGLAGAQVKADATRATAAVALTNGEGANEKNKAEAKLANFQASAIEYAQAHGELTPAETVQWARTGQVPVGYIPRDAITGVPFTVGPGGTLGQAQLVQKNQLTQQLQR